MTLRTVTNQNLDRQFAPIMAVAPEHEPQDIIAVETRFGVIEFDRQSIITFPKGIPGFKGYQDFGLTSLPIASESNLMLMQSIDPSDLSFVICSYDVSASLIAVEDLARACDHLGISPQDCAVALIANFHRDGENTELSVNLRAPILIDTANRLAWQHILTNEQYQVRHMLG